MDLVYCKSQRRITRTELRNYLVLYRDDIVREFDVVLPSTQEIKQMKGSEFDNWFMLIKEKILKNNDKDVVLAELIDNYICSVNNVETAEYELTLIPQ